MHKVGKETSCGLLAFVADIEWNHEHSVLYKPMQTNINTISHCNISEPDDGFAIHGIIP